MGKKKGFYLMIVLASFFGVLFVMYINNLIAYLAPSVIYTTGANAQKADLQAQVASGHLDAKQLTADDFDVTKTCRVAFVSAADGGASYVNVMSVTADSMQIDTVVPQTPQSVQYHNPVWSPDGQYIAAWYSDKEGNNGVEVLSLQLQRAVVHLSVGDMTIKELRWSPDSKQFGFAGQSNKDESVKYYTVTADNTLAEIGGLYLTWPQKVESTVNLNNIDSAVFHQHTCQSGYASFGQSLFCISPLVLVLVFWALVLAMT